MPFGAVDSSSISGTTQGRGALSGLRRRSAVRPIVMPSDDAARAISGARAAHASMAASGDSAIPFSRACLSAALYGATRSRALAVTGSTDAGPAGPAVPTGSGRCFFEQAPSDSPTRESVATTASAWCERRRARGREAKGVTVSRGYRGQTISFIHDVGPANTAASAEALRASPSR